MTETGSIASQIENILRDAESPLSVDEICAQIWKRIGNRERGIVRVNLHRLDERGLLVKLPMKYQFKKEERPLSSTLET